MNEKNINDFIAVYKQQLANEDIRATYEFLIKYVMAIKTTFEKEYGHKYSCGNISLGYMDFTYFSFFDPYLRGKKLRFGIVLNHKEIRFELWLMGQNLEVQNTYWSQLKSTQWNRHLSTKPKYSVFETVLAENPDFAYANALTAKIINTADVLASEITQYIKKECD